MAVIADPFEGIVLDAHVHVFLPVHENLLAAFLSSKRISLKPEPPLLELDFKVDIVLLSGKG